MKFIYFSDSHIKGKTPRYRTGDYFQDIKAKIIEVLKLAVDYNCDTIFCGGDLFDSPLVSLNICDEIIDLIEDCGIDFYCVTGNHDEIGHNPNLSGQTILGHLFKRTKYVKDSSIYEKEDEDLSATQPANIDRTEVKTGIRIENSDDETTSTPILEDVSFSLTVYFNTKIRLTIYGDRQLFKTVFSLSLQVEVNCRSNHVITDGL